MRALDDMLDENTVKNAIVLDSSTYCNCAVWMKVMAQLKKVMNIQTRYFFYYNNKQFNREVSTFSASMREKVFYQTAYDAWKGKGFYAASKNNVIDNDLLLYTAQYELICLKMMDRLDPLGDSFSFSHRQYFFRDLLLTWLDIIDEMDIKIVFSPDVPHKIYDYVLYVAAKIRKIEFVCFQQTPFSDASYILDDVDRLPLYISSFLTKAKQVRRDSIDSNISEILGDPTEYQPAYMIEQEARNQTKSINHWISKISQRALHIYNKGYLFHPLPILSKIKNQLHTPWTLHVSKGCMPQQESQLNILSRIKKRIKINGILEAHRAMYEKSLSRVPLASQKYVFIALHYQPEETTSPTGGVYVDQLLIIEMLDRLLPKEYQILVKEHTSQFYNFTESTCGRSRVFYERLSSFSPRVKVIETNVRSMGLIDGATAVVTVSGTVGFESIIRGKPVLVFGRAWYEPLPGVYRIRDKYDLIKCWNIIDKANFKLTINEVRESLNKLSGLFIEAKHSGVYFKVSDRPDSLSVNNIVNGVSNHFKNKISFRGEHKTGIF